MSRVDSIIHIKENIDLLNSLTDSDIVIYHYTSPDGLLGILGDDERIPHLRFTQYNSLNDQKERKNILESLKRYCQSREHLGLMNREFIQRIEQLELSDYHYITYDNGEVESNIMPGQMVHCTKISEEECDLYLCCFSEDNDLLPMWNYYSKSQHYEGYCIGFYGNNFNTGYEKGYDIQVKRVIYSNQDKNKIWDNTIMPLYNIYINPKDENEKEEVIRGIFTIVDDLQLVFKDEAFSHEKEIRAIIKVPKNKRSEGIDKHISKRKYRNSNGYIVPYVDYYFYKGCVPSITIAPLLEKEMAKENLDDMLKQYGYHGVTVFASNIPIRF